MEEKIKVEGGMEFSLYEMNKQVINQLPKVDDKTVLTEIRKFKNETGKYFMLLFRDINYYTLFVIEEGNEARIEQEVLECLKELGEVKSIELNEKNGAVEIWIKQEETSTVGYFFNYDKGVIVCH